MNECIVNVTTTTWSCTTLKTVKSLLVPPPQALSEHEVEGYWLGLDDTDNDSESDSSCSEQ